MTPERVFEASSGRRLEERVAESGRAKAGANARAL